MKYPQLCDIIFGEVNYIRFFPSLENENIFGIVFVCVTNLINLLHKLVYMQLIYLLHSALGL